VTPRPLDSALALDIVHRMGEAGLPPERGLDEVNVGTESYLKILDEEYLLSHLLVSGASSFKLVQGTYGAGKTHFLYCLRERASRRGYLSSFVTLTSSKGECPFDSPLHVYQASAQSLSLPAGNEPAISRLPDILRHWVEHQASERGNDEVLEWIDKTLARSRIELQPFRVAVCRFLRAVVTGQAAEQYPLEAWLLGQPVPVTEVRPMGIYDAPRERNAFAMLRSMVQTVRILGLPGTVLLFDEGEKQLSFARVDARSTREVLNNLRETIDLCGRSDLPGTLVVYAVTPDFVHNVLPRYPALQQRLMFPVATMSVRSPLAPVIDLETLDLNPEELLYQLGDRLASVYRTAYGWLPARGDLEQNLRALVAETLTYQLEVGHRRIFVKTWLRLLDEGRRAGAQRITREDAARAMRAMYTPVPAGPKAVEENDEEEEEFLDA
jgi:hypothetical protein